MFLPIGVPIGANFQAYTFSSSSYLLCSPHIIYGRHIIDFPYPGLVNNIYQPILIPLKEVINIDTGTLQNCVKHISAMS